MKQAKDYLVFPLDFSTLDQSRDFVKKLSPHVGMFKVGLELFIGQGPGVIKMIRDNSDAKVFLDLKLHDISKTVERAMGQVADLGVDLVTVHCGSSRQMLEAAVKGAKGKTGVLGVTLLTDMDAAGVAQAGFKDKYSLDPGLLVMKRACTAFDAGCSGVVCSGKEAMQVKKRFGPGFLAVTPGIRPEFSLPANDDQKRVVTPGNAIHAGSDLLVIGRPIKEAADPEQAAVLVLSEITSALAD